MSVSSAGNVPAFSGRNTPVQFGGAVRSEAPGATHFTDLVGSSVEAHGTVDRGALLRLTAGSGVAEHSVESPCVGVGGGKVEDWYARGEVSDGAMMPAGAEFRPATLTSLDEFLAVGEAQNRPGCVGVGDASTLRSLCEKPEGEIGGPYNFGADRITLDRDF